MSSTTFTSDTAVPQPPLHATSTHNDSLDPDNEEIPDTEIPDSTSTSSISTSYGIFRNLAGDPLDTGINTPYDFLQFQLHIVRRERESNGGIFRRIYFEPNEIAGCGDTTIRPYLPEHVGPACGGTSPPGVYPIFFNHVVRGEDLLHAASFGSDEEGKEGETNLTAETNPDVKSKPDAKAPNLTAETNPDAKPNPKDWTPTTPGYEYKCPCEAAFWRTALAEKFRIPRWSVMLMQVRLGNTDVLRKTRSEEIARSEEEDTEFEQSEVSDDCIFDFDNFEYSYLIRSNSMKSADLVKLAEDLTNSKLSRRNSFGRIAQLERDICEGRDTDVDFDLLCSARVVEMFRTLAILGPEGARLLCHEMMYLEDDSSARKYIEFFLTAVCAHPHRIDQGGGEEEEEDDTSPTWESKLERRLLSVGFKDTPYLPKHPCLWRYILSGGVGKWLCEALREFPIRGESGRAFIMECLSRRKKKGLSGFAMKGGGADRRVESFPFSHLGRAPFFWAFVHWEIKLDRKCIREGIKACGPRFLELILNDKEFYNRKVVVIEHKNDDESSSSENGIEGETRLDKNHIHNADISTNNNTATAKQISVQWYKDEKEPIHISGEGDEKEEDRKILHDFCDVSKLPQIEWLHGIPMDGKVSNGISMDGEDCNRSGLKVVFRHDEHDNDNVDHARISCDIQNSAFENKFIFGTVQYISTEQSSITNTRCAEQASSSSSSITKTTVESSMTKTMSTTNTKSTKTTRSAKTTSVPIPLKSFLLYDKLIVSHALGTIKSGGSRMSRTGGIHQSTNMSDITRLCGYPGYNTPLWNLRGDIDILSAVLSHDNAKDQYRFLEESIEGKGGGRNYLSSPSGGRDIDLGRNPSPSSSLTSKTKASLMQNFDKWRSQCGGWNAILCFSARMRQEQDTKKIPFRNVCKPCKESHRHRMDLSIEYFEKITELSNEGKQIVDALKKKESVLSTLWSPNLMERDAPGKNRTENGSNGKTHTLVLGREEDWHNIISRLTRAFMAAMGPAMLIKMAPIKPFRADRSEKSRLESGFFKDWLIPAIMAKVGNNGSKYNHKWEKLLIMWKAKREKAEASTRPDECLIF